jgi:hypothetical protein
MDWKRVAKYYWADNKEFTKRYEYEDCVINTLAKEFEKEDKTGIFNSSKVRDLTAAYAMYLHRHDISWVPGFKNNVTLWRVKKDITKFVNRILYQDRRRQMAVNIGFIILAVHFIYTISN